MRLSGTQARSISSSRGLGNQLWDLAGNRPSLDLRFADSKSLVDATTGTNLVDFTRASSGTYVGSDGLIKTATTNLVTYSEEFDDASWTSLSPTVNPNTHVSPTGTLTADTVEAQAINQSVGAFESVSYTFSLYVNTSATTSSAVRVRYGFTGGSASFWLVTSTSAIGTVNTGITNVNSVSVGGGWYRIHGTLVIPAGTTSLNINISGVASDGSGTISGAVVLWGAQLEQSSTVGEYVKTTSTINSAPRFDHDPTTGESLGLLVEEQRQNLLLQSEDFSTTWAKTNINVNNNAIASPAGTLNGNKLVSNNSSVGYVLQDSPSLPLTGDHTYSFYAKADEWNWVLLWVYNGASAYTFNFNLGNGTSPDGDIVAVGNGWYRCSKTVTLLGGTYSGRVRIYPNNQQGPSVTTGDGTSGIYIWGAQLEEGSFPTSYIPTEGSAVTRAADVASISGSNFSSWYRQDEGTVFSEANFTNTVSYNTVYNITDGTGAERIRTIQWNDGSNRVFSYVSGGSTQASFIGAGVTGRTKNTGAYKVDDFAAVQDGGPVQTDSSGSISTTVNSMDLGSTSTAFVLNGHISRLTFWPQRLPNDTLQTITQ